MLGAEFLRWHAGDERARAGWVGADMTAERDDGVGLDKIWLGVDLDRDKAGEIGRSAVQGFGQEIAGNGEPLGWSDGTGSDSLYITPGPGCFFARNTA
jgi:hypothetical protein